MTKISFTIIGTHADPLGNPLPKLKMTGKQHWMPKAKNYVRWKEFVQISLIEELNRINKEAGRDAARNIAALGKPLVLGDRYAEMHIEIAWKNGAHGDPENIFGSIADALFHNDKNLYGSFLPMKDENEKTGGRVRCTITVSDPQPKQKRGRHYKP